VKFADIGKKIDRGVEKTKENTNKVTENIKNKVYKHEDRVKCREIQDEINNHSLDLLAELLLEIEKKNVSDFQSNEGFEDVIDSLKANTTIKNNIYQIRMLQYKKNVLKEKINKILKNNAKENKNVFE
jgi:hypothetical protein